MISAKGLDLFLSSLSLKVLFMRNVSEWKRVHTPWQAARHAGLQVPSFWDKTPSPDGF